MFLDTNSSTNQWSSKTIVSYGFCLLFCGAVFTSFGLFSEANATTISHGYNISFGQTPPDGPAPYATYTFDDANSPGTVTLTIDVAATVGAADLAALYFNLNPSLDPTSLSFVRTGGTGPVAGDIDVFTGVDAFMADGDGMYDILIDMPPPPGSQSARFQAGENLIFAVSGIATLVATDFEFFSAPPPGPGGAGPFLSVARFISTGVGGNDSDWQGVVPEPTTVTLFGLAALAMLVRRTRIHL